MSQCRQLVHFNVPCGQSRCSFHSTVHSSDDTMTSKSSSNESPNVSQSGRNLSISHTFISGTLSDGELQSPWSKASQLLCKMKPQDLMVILGASQVTHRHHHISSPNRIPIQEDTCVTINV